MLDLKTEPFGLPYNFHEFQEYCQRMGMEHHITTPEDAQANGFAEAFKIIDHGEVGAHSRD